MNKSLRLIVTLVPAFIVVLLVGGDTSGYGQSKSQLLFRTDGAAFTICACEARQEVLLSQYGRYDTTRFTSLMTLALLSPIDTLVITPDAEQIEVIIAGPSDTLYELFIYADSKLEALRNFSKFNSSPASGIPQFTYSPRSESLLVQLRIEYDLDSVAGTGDDVSRILNLLHWAHTIVPHDGSSKNPDPRNALNLIKVCRDEKRGVNCRMIATILNEACLAEGFASRHVTCMPQDTTDQDCHVTNMVYVPKLGKWIYVDPTFNGYFSDGNGQLLSPSEVRERMIEGKPLVLPDDLDWNGKPKNKQEYLAYMRKNLFRFSCPLGSEAGYESRDGRRQWVYLNPTGYDSARIGRANTPVTKTKFVDYYTDDADFFWAKP
ncbi:MAG: transglutaminase domain-containing protein [Candidatus Zixiibacteriota bacterium]|nr:MAG: transglutaminase domain-containing protein [candidate division Zixibacteria bacterium]